MLLTFDEFRQYSDSLEIVQCLALRCSSRSYLEQVKRSEATRVGQAVLDLYSQGNTSDEDFLQQVKELASKAQSVIDTAEKQVEEHGRHKFDEW